MINQLSKTCNKCKEIKNLSLFSKNKSAKDGFQAECKCCMSVRALAWQTANPDKVNLINKRHAEKRLNTSKKWSLDNPDKIKAIQKRTREKHQQKRLDYTRQWRENNRDKICQSNKLWRKNNLDKVTAKHAKRNSAKKDACPPWFELVRDEVNSIYSRAKELEKTTGHKYNVDHIIPLRPKKCLLFEGELIELVCGLHVPSNLQILTKTENLKKGNQFKSYVESELPLDSVYIHKGASLVAQFGLQC